MLPSRICSIFKNPRGVFAGFTFREISIESLQNQKFAPVGAGAVSGAAAAAVKQPMLRISAISTNKSGGNKLAATIALAMAERQVEKMSVKFLIMFDGLRPGLYAFDILDAAV